MNLADGECVAIAFLVAASRKLKLTAKVRNRHTALFSLQGHQYLRAVLLRFLHDNLPVHSRENSTSTHPCISGDNALATSGDHALVVTFFRQVTND